MCLLVVVLCWTGGTNITLTVPLGKRQIMREVEDEPKPNIEPLIINVFSGESRTSQNLGN